MNNYLHNDFPMVSVIIPCYNEEKFIGKCLDSIIANGYPKDKLEILVVDGMSEDGTREILEGYKEKYSFLKILNNPKKITPVAFNIGIKNSKGKIVMIMCAHATYEKEYISKCVKYLSEYNADNVGGIMITIPRNNTLVGKAIVLALSHRFGVGDSNFRVGSKETKWVDTVLGGCYKKEVFDKIGLFNEKLISTQDMEFNLKLKKAGGKILLVPDIISYYYTHSELKSFCKNNFRNGFWAIYPFKFTDTMPVSLRHLVPLIFVLSLIGSGAVSFFFLFFKWIFLSIIVSYSLINVYFSIKISIQKNDFRYLFLMPMLFTMLHIGYGAGSIWGGLKLLLPVKRKTCYNG